jgi:hypothetical protein
MLHSEFRDGNVPACYDQLRVLKEALSYLPSGVVKVRIRSDSAGYVHELLRHCEMKLDDRFGRIEFAIGCDVTPEFKRAVAWLREATVAAFPDYDERQSDLQSVWDSDQHGLARR